MTQREKTALAALLDHHFGDGMVYLRDRGDRSLLAHAMQLGLVSEEGYLTSAGHSFWRAHQDRLDR